MGSLAALMTSSDITDWLVNNHDALRDRTTWIRDAYQKFKPDLDPDILYYARYQALSLVRQEIETEVLKNLSVDPYDVMIVLDTPALAYFLE
jgi:hypothetical protein